MLTSMKSWLGGSNSGEDNDLLEAGVTPPDCVTVDNAEQHPDSGGEDDIKKVLATAKDWSHYLFTLGKSATEIAAKNVTSTAKYLSEQMAENDLLEKAPVLSDFHREQARFIAEQQRQSPSGVSEQQMEHSSSTSPFSAAEGGFPLGDFPWSDCETTAEADTLREQVFQLSKDERNFLRNPSVGANFASVSVGALHHMAVALLQADPALHQMRFQLVPRKIKEDTFWRNYFYRISLIKQSVRLRCVTGHKAATDQSADDKNTQGSKQSQSSTESYDRLSDFDDVKGDVASTSHKQHIPTIVDDANPTDDADMDGWDDDLQQELREFELLHDGKSFEPDEELERELSQKKT